MRRRELMALVGGAAAMPVLTRAARGQQAPAMRRIAVLMNLAADDREAQPLVAAFRQALQQLGWSDERNLRIDYRWGANNAAETRKYAAELVALMPDIILAGGTQSVAAFQQLTRSLPIVFVQVSDPIGAGLVETLARPGGNTTGFMLFEYNFTGKLLELLKEVAPGVTRIAVLRDAANPAGSAQFGAIQATARSLGVEVVPVNVREAGEIERALASFATSPNGGLVVTGSASTTVHHDLIIALAARYKLPAVYSDSYNVTGGGLISYGPERRDQYRRAAGYIDRILKGERPGDLPVQAPTGYELVVNLKTAKAIGLDVPASVLARADQVIE